MEPVLSKYGQEESGEHLRDLPFLIRVVNRIYLGSQGLIV